ncbi:hypothetical protein Tco_1367587 [Tanacetum coccineum]
MVEARNCQSAGFSERRGIAQRVAFSLKIKGYSSSDSRDWKEGMEDSISIDHVDTLVIRTDHDWSNYTKEVSTAGDAGEFALMGVTSEVHNCPFGCDNKYNELQKQYNELNEQNSEYFIQSSAYKELHLETLGKTKRVLQSVFTSNSEEWKGSSLFNRFAKILIVMQRIVLHLSLEDTLLYSDHTVLRCNHKNGLCDKSSEGVGMNGNAGKPSAGEVVTWKKGHMKRSLIVVCSRSLNVVTCLSKEMDDFKSSRMKKSDFLVGVGIANNSNCSPSLRFETRRIEFSSQTLIVLYYPRTLSFQMIAIKRDKANQFYRKNSSFANLAVHTDADFKDSELIKFDDTPLDLLKKFFIKELFKADLKGSASVQEEMQQFKFQNVWVLIDLPEDKYAIGTKWILKNKRDAMGIVVRKRQVLQIVQHSDIGVGEEVLIMMTNGDLGVRFSYMVGIDEELYVINLKGFVDPQIPRRSTRGAPLKTLFLKKHKRDILWYKFMWMTSFLDLHTVLVQGRNQVTPTTSQFWKQQ